MTSYMSHVSNLSVHAAAKLTARGLVGGGRLGVVVEGLVVVEVLAQ